MNKFKIEWSQKKKRKKKYVFLDFWTKLGS